MHIRYGYSMEIECHHSLAILAMLDVHPSRRNDITLPDTMEAVRLTDGSPVDVSTTYIDKFGNICRRIVAPEGGISLYSEGVIYDSGFHEPQGYGASIVSPENLPSETLMYLLGSRYCETDKLSDQAWTLFGNFTNGWDKVQAVCDYVHNRIKFDYSLARSTRTALEAFEERVGVCRDFAHLAVTFCRCLNIPARYCTGYLGDIGVPIDPNPMDFSAWFEVYLDGKWWTLDARHNTPRIGRIVIARGRDATDVPMINSFGMHTLRKFEVITDEVEGARFPVSPRERREHWEKPNLMASAFVAA